LPNQVVEFYSSIETPPREAVKPQFSNIDFTKNYARTGEVIDAKYLQQHPDQLKANF